MPTRYSPVRRSVKSLVLPKDSKQSASLDLHVLGTPPAFILSQDQTLVKNVCSKFRTNVLANSSLFTVVWFRFDRSPSSEQSSSLRWLRQCSLALFPENKFSGPIAVLARSPLFENFLFKEIFKGCCLLFSYQGSCRSFFATALIFYQISFALSRTFLFFFSVVPLPSRSASSDSLYRLSHLQGVVKNFFNYFLHSFQTLYSQNVLCFIFILTDEIEIKQTEKEGFEPSRRY